MVFLPCLSRLKICLLVITAECYSGNKLIRHGVIKIEAI